MQAITDAIDAIYRSQSRPIFATLVRLLGDFELAEEALHEAFAAALRQWPNEGLPKNPSSWLISTGRYQAISVIRRRTTHDAKLELLARTLEQTEAHPSDTVQPDVSDDRLRLIFTCCHPALSRDTQVALTLREVCGLTTEQVAAAFLVPATTLAQRIVRGKAKIRTAKIPYQVPSREDLPERLDSVLSVIYLVFNEGYSPSSGTTPTCPELSEEAIRLSQLLLELLPDPEIRGLLALMQLHESRRRARISDSGDFILLEDQDRSQWDQDRIAIGLQLLQQALLSRRFGTYTIQAALSAVHSEASHYSATDWNQIVALYDLLFRTQPSPVIELNRAVAVAMRDGFQAGLDLIEAIFQRGELLDYQLAHAAKADLCRRLGFLQQAKTSYQRALELTQQEPSRRFLHKRIREIDH
jgi:RNA polymerase sigma-70 factor, ECF subfamily